MRGTQFSRNQLLLLALVTPLWGWTFERQAWPPLPAAERARWHIYDAVLISGLAQPAWLLLARDLSALASTLSVMLIPVLGTVSGAWFLDESLYWQDGTALALVGIAILSVLWTPGLRQIGDQSFR